MKVPPPPLPAGLFCHGEAPVPLELTEASIAPAAKHLAREGRMILIAHRDRLPVDLPPVDERERVALSPARTANSLEGALARRKIARALLALVAGNRPSDWSVCADARGAPRVSGAESGWFVSFSGRGPLGLIGLARQPIGVDLEIETGGLDIPFNILTPDEARILRGFPPSLQRRLFIRLWAAKEAIAKAAGTGFSHPPESIPLPMPGFDSPLDAPKHPMIVLTREGLNVFESANTGSHSQAGLRVTVAMVLG
jgi:phosphopantetheinyl transferase